MRAEAIVAKLLEDDPKEFVQRNAVHLRLADYFNEDNGTRRWIENRKPDEPNVAAYFEIKWDASEKRPYVALGVGMEDTDTGNEIYRGGFGQVFALNTDRDLKAFMADLDALEKAITVDFNEVRAVNIVAKIVARIAYNRPHGYADRRGRS